MWTVDIGYTWILARVKRVRAEYDFVVAKTKVLETKLRAGCPFVSTKGFASDDLAATLWQPQDRLPQVVLDPGAIGYSASV
jgi:hypothetical protein